MQGNMEDNTAENLAKILKSATFRDDNGKPRPWWTIYLIIKKPIIH